MGVILGITPARGSSKGIKKKNICEIGAKPLIAWTIEQAQRSKLLSKYIVSTEDKDIALIAKQYGAEVLKRPVRLASDTASTLSVLQHAIEAIPADTVVLLQPTSPIRKSGLIDECIAEFLENDYDSLATGFICKYTEYGKSTLRRQEEKGFFYDDGCVYVIKTVCLKKGDRFGKKIGRKIISAAEHIDIDDEFDLWVAEKIIKEKNFIF